MISKNLKKRIITSLFLILTIFIIFYSKPLMALILIIIGNFSIIEFSNITKKILKKNFFNVIFNIIFIIYIFLFCLFFFMLCNYIQIKLILFSFLFCCIASDIGGYIFGKILKGPKLTKISPKKTIFGAVGSIVCSSLTLYIIFLFFLVNSNLNFLLIGAIVSIGCQFGDIFFSYLKRKAKLKDTGKFLPGHGGFLDRIDGILLGIPVGFVALKILF